MDKSVSRDQHSVTHTKCTLYNVVLMHIAPLSAPLTMQHIVGATAEPQTAKMAHEWPTNGPRTSSSKSTGKASSKRKYKRPETNRWPHARGLRHVTAHTWAECRTVSTGGDLDTMVEQLSMLRLAENSALESRILCRTCK